MRGNDRKAKEKLNIVMMRKRKSPRVFVKIQEINFVECHDAQDINVLTDSIETYYDAQDTLCLESTLSAEVLISGQV